MDINVGVNDRVFVKTLTKGIEGEIEGLRRRNDDPKKSEVDTALIRGEIKALKRLAVTLNPKEKLDMKVNL